MNYLGRLAPSPTGPLHFGITRSLLGAWLDARHAGGRLVLRIEDLDRPRVVPGAAENLLRDLEWLGLDWDEGPGRPGGAGPYFQSEREDRYRARLTQLEASGLVFPCSCSRREILAAASAPHGDEGPRYPGTCRRGPQPGRPAALRLRVEPGSTVEHQDRLYGGLSEDVGQAVGDFILRRADGIWAYQFAVVVDDLEQGVTDVVRGRDLLASTARQLSLRRTLAPDAPALRTLHLPMVLSPVGRRLAKRDGAAAIALRRERGDRPEAVLGDLARSFGLPVPPGGAPADVLVALWEPARLSRQDYVLAD